MKDTVKKIRSEGETPQKNGGGKRAGESNNIEEAASRAKREEAGKGAGGGNTAGEAAAGGDRADGAAVEKCRVRLRELKRGDLPALEAVVRKTWSYDKFAGPATAGRLAKLYLASCLANQTYARVAEVNGVPVGLILGKNRSLRRCPVRYRIRQTAALCGLLLQREGREILKFYKGVDAIDDRLLRQCGKEYGGEVALFALAPEYRGMGIGKLLFTALLDYMRGEGIREFYLYTDTSCNFGFYEHQGMTRRQRYRQSVSLKGQKGEAEFYLYDMTL